MFIGVAVEWAEREGEDDDNEEKEEEDTDKSVGKPEKEDGAAVVEDEIAEFADEDDAGTEDIGVSDFTGGEGARGARRRAGERARPRGVA